MGAPQEDPPQPDGFSKRMTRYMKEKLLDWLQRTRVVEGQGTYLTDAPGGGKSVNVDPAFVATALGSVPFDVIAGGGDVRVRLGFVNSELPDGMALGDDPPFTISVPAPGVVYVVLEVDIDTDTNLWSITDVSIDAAASMPSPSATHAYQVLGSVSAGGVVASERIGHLSWERAGNATTFLDTWYPAAV